MCLRKPPSFFTFLRFFYRCENVLSDRAPMRFYAFYVFTLFFQEKFIRGLAVEKLWKSGSGWKTNNRAKNRKKRKIVKTTNVVEFGEFGPDAGD